MGSYFLEVELKKRGYQPQWSGTQYVREACKRMMEETPPRRISMSKEMYPALARESNVSPAAVERAMRYAVHKAEPGHTVSGAVYGITAVCKAYED